MGNRFATLHYEYLLGDSTRKIVRGTCQAIWECLLPLYISGMDRDFWMKISQDFNEQTQFPNRIGAIDGKYIRIRKPDKSGSELFNYKSFFSGVLLVIYQICNYNFIYEEVGSYGSSSD